MPVPYFSPPKVNDEFQRILRIDENALHDDVSAFLREARDSFGKGGEKGLKGPLQRMSLMHYAAMGNATELMRYLLRSGAKVNCRDGIKRTPLSWAAEFGALEVTEMLIAHGAALNPLDDLWSTPLSWCINIGAGNSKATEKLLIEKGAKCKGSKTCESSVLATQNVVSTA